MATISKERSGINFIEQAINPKVNVTNVLNNFINK